MREMSKPGRGAAPDLEEQYVSAAEIAKRQGVSSATIRRRIAAGRFPGALHDGFSWRIPLSAYAAFLEDCARRPPGPPVVELRGGAFDADRAFSSAVRRLRDELCGAPPAARRGRR